MLPVSGTTVSKSALAKVPFVSFIPEDGRLVSLLPFFEDKTGTFKIPFPRPDGIVLGPGKPMQGPYYAKSVIEEGDLQSELIEYVTLSWSFPSTMKILVGIERDLINCSSVVEKYFVFLNKFRSEKDVMIANLVMTDVEFLFGNIRSLYDSLQVLIGDILEKAGNKKAHLPKSYYDMVKLDETKMLEKYDLAEPLQKFYADTKEFFLVCRKIRGGFQHWRIDIPVIYCFDDGFALQRENAYLKDPVGTRFRIWPEDKIKKNGLVSLLGLIGYLHSTIIAHMDLLAKALKASFSTPKAISKDFKIFFTGPHIRHLKLSDYYQKEQWIALSEAFNQDKDVEPR
jgi:hypothetical protein